MKTNQLHVGGKTAVLCRQMQVNRWDFLIHGRFFINFFGIKKNNLSLFLLQVH